MSKYVWGVDVGGTFIKLGLFSDEGECIDHFEIPTIIEDKGSRILPDIAAAIKDYMDKNHYAREDVSGIGLAVPGPVDSEGIITKAVNLGWGVFNINKEMEELTGLKVFAINDADAAAAGEIWQGAAKGEKSAVMITLGTGIGGGIFLENGLLIGRKGSAGEIGHIPVNDGETVVCKCGNKGCVEQYSSARGIIRVAKLLLEESNKPSKLRDYEEITPREVFALAEEGDAIALEVVDRFGYHLGKAIGIIISIIAPEVVVIGGGVSKAGKIVLDAIEKYYKDYTFHASRDVPLVLAKLDNRAGMYGAAKILLDELKKN